MSPKTTAARKLVEVTGSKTVNPIVGFLKPKDLKKGQVIAGNYRGSYTSGDYNGKTHKIELENTAEVFTRGEKNTAKAGDLIGLNDCAGLSEAMSRLTPGAYVHITYNGKVKKQGKKGAYSEHLFTVLSEEGSINEAAATEVEATDDTDSDEIPF